MRHRRYDDLSSVLPTVNSHFQQRSDNNPDFIYLEDQVALAQETREITELPLNEKARIAFREGQEKKALNIENKRRKAKGEELLTSLEEETDEEEDPVEDADSATLEEEEEEEPDVLLSEAANVLVDVLMLKKARYAVHHGAESAQ